MEGIQAAQELEIRLLVDEEFEQRLKGFEERLATAMTKALDTVVEEYNARLRVLEEDQARINKHLGLGE